MDPVGSIVAILLDEFVCWPESLFYITNIWQMWLKASKETLKVFYLFKEAIS